VGDRDIGRLARMGHQIVCVARMKEEDDIWISRGLHNGADIFISRDLDIPNILDRWRAKARWFETIEKFLTWNERQKKEIKK
jgi:hypothetical protein